MRLRAFVRTASIIAGILLMFFACQRDDEATNYLAGKQALFLQNFTRHTPDKGFKDYVIASLIKHDSVTPFFNNFYAQYGQPLWDAEQPFGITSDGVLNWVVPVANPSRENLTALMLFSASVNSRQLKMDILLPPADTSLYAEKKLLFETYRRRAGLQPLTPNVSICTLPTDHYSIAPSGWVTGWGTECYLTYNCRGCPHHNQELETGWYGYCTSNIISYFEDDDNASDLTDQYLGGANGGGSYSGGSGSNDGWYPGLPGGGGGGGPIGGTPDPPGDEFPGGGGGIPILLPNPQLPAQIAQTLDTEKEFNDMMFYYRSRAKNDNFEWLCSKIVGQQQVVSAKGKPEGLSVGFHEGDLEWVVHTHYPGTVGMYSAGDLAAIVNLAATERITYNFWMGLVNAEEQRYTLAVSDPLAFTAFCAKYKDNPNQLITDYEEDDRYFNEEWADEQIKDGFIRFLKEKNTGLILFEDTGEPFKPIWTPQL